MGYFFLKFLYPSCSCSKMISAGVTFQLFSSTPGLNQCFCKTPRLYPYATEM